MRVLHIAISASACGVCSALRPSAGASASSGLTRGFSQTSAVNRVYRRRVSTALWQAPVESPPVQVCHPYELDERRVSELVYLPYLETLSRRPEQKVTSTRRDGGSAVDRANKASSPSRRLSWGSDLARDWQQRLPLYKDDWKTGFRAKSLSTTAFMYFACLMPAVAFGGFAQQVTGGAMGVVEYLVACGGSGVAYSLFSGQPMTFTGPTGLTLAFITALHAFTSAAALPFLPVYTWCGLWTSALMVALAAGGASNLVRYATQFTDDVFNALIALNFLAEACGGLARNFKLGGAGGSGGALLAVNVAGASYLLTQALTQARGSVYFNKGVREQVSDFGPVLAIAAMTAVSHLPAVSSIGLDFLSVPASFMLQGGRGWLSPLLSVPVSVRLLCLLPALLLTSLFFLDQNISARVVNRPAHKLKKPPAYHQDLLTLGVITGVLSVLGLPWQCAATVQSLNHVRALSTTQVVDGPDGEKQEVVTEVCETRVTGFATHALILMSVGALPLLRLIPMPVVSGMFLYLGRKVMCGNGFFERITDLCMDPKLMGSGSVVKAVGRGTALRYTAVQALMLALLWTLKSFSQTALLFPSVIGLLVVMRLTVLPKLFSDRSLRLLDPPVA